MKWLIVILSCISLMSIDDYHLFNVLYSHLDIFFCTVTFEEIYPVFLWIGI